MTERYLVFGSLAVSKSRCSLLQILILDGGLLKAALGALWAFPLPTPPPHPPRSLPSAALPEEDEDAVGRGQHSIRFRAADAVAAEPGQVLVVGLLSVQPNSH